MKRVMYLEKPLKGRVIGLDEREPVRRRAQARARCTLCPLPH